MYFTPPSSTPTRILVFIPFKKRHISFFFFEGEKRPRREIRSSSRQKTARVSLFSCLRDHQKSNHFRPNRDRDENRHVVLGFSDDWRAKRRRDDETRVHRASSFLPRFLSCPLSLFQFHCTATVVYAGTDTRTNTRTLSLSLSKNDAENKTPSRSALLGATNQTNHAKLRRRVFPTHGAIQFRTRPTGVPQRAERHRRIPNENRREEQRNQRTESTNRKRRPIIIIINNNNNNNASNNARLFGVPEHIRRKERRASKTTERKSKRRTEKSTHHRKRRPIVILITHIYCFHNVFVRHLNACARERKRERRARARKHT